MRILTAGESHGKGLIGILEGFPSHLEVRMDALASQMQRRKMGYGRSHRQNIETDRVEILSGVRHSKTLGSPIALMIPNLDYAAWEEIMSIEAIQDTLQHKTMQVPRPGHADWAGSIKYHHHDLRNVLERASARETAMRVALGTFYRWLLLECGVFISSRVMGIGDIHDTTAAALEPSLEAWKSFEQRMDASSLRMHCSEANAQAVCLIQGAAQKGDTLGGSFEVQAVGVPVGLGSYVHFDRKLDGKLGQAFLSLNAIKAISIGSGMINSTQYGSEVHDPYLMRDEKIQTISNRAGGIAGGVSTGNPIIVTGYMKPLSTLQKPLPSVNVMTQEPQAAHVERSDVCAVPSAAVIGESLMAIVLAQEMLLKFGGDSMQELTQRVAYWRKHADTLP